MSRMSPGRVGRVIAQRRTGCGMRLLQQVSMRDVVKFDSAGGEVAAGVGASLTAERKAAEEAAARAIAEEEAEKAAFWAGLEHVPSEQPEPPEPPPSVTYITEGNLGGGSSGMASTATFSLVSEATHALASEAKKLGDYVVKQVKYEAHRLWADIYSTATLDAAQCAQGALAMNNALEKSLESWPLVEAFSLVVGCLAETQDGHVDS
jgi:hypothetical protein